MGCRDTKKGADKAWRVAKSCAEQRPLWLIVGSTGAQAPMASSERVFLRVQRPEQPLV